MAREGGEYQKAPVFIDCPTCEALVPTILFAKTRAEWAGHARFVEGKRLQYGQKALGPGVEHR